MYTPASDEVMPEMNNMFVREIGNLEITREDIKSRLERINVTKSSGPDNIHPYVLQKTAGVTCIPLEIIFKKSINSGECPTDWRSANVAPIHKMGTELTQAIIGQLA